MWMLTFFVASPAASAAYLTISELFPLEIRAMAISLFIAVGSGCGGLFSPLLFSALVGSGSRVRVLYGYLFGAVLMLFAALMELLIGVDAEGRSLEALAPPLSAVAQDHDMELDVDLEHDLEHDLDLELQSPA
eukprot:NODE_5202_length_594_cov_49.899083_g4499_i0.p2 GENE.NODE_5202_length_594_cov_49.899083_g4499_i0~~NODE_5202_length_594_cov_49.899083_g4499_i0.p2  ORF type:complete len:133 (-),score=37.12 NODE_5202_length_594_cov_49.899083_g4499_i0:100-498(-)